MQVLTKSKYLTGLQCPKYLWIVFHEKEAIPQASLADEFKSKEIEKVGQLPKKLFPEMSISYGITESTKYSETLKYKDI
ncbi:hypothetical protein GF351_00985 [Candidatus Woesearchaeota archaeon]|nr:hypothetical protein [Candidatus Woesearchaeota archaeon]